MNKHESSKRPGHGVVKAVASLARGVAKGSTRSTSEIFIYQPEEPKDLAKRLQAMKK